MSHRLTVSPSPYLQRTGAKIVLKECRLLSLSQDIIDRWKGEMEIIKRLDHQNIVRALNIPPGLDPMALGDTPCICMEYCDGGDLRQVRALGWAGQSPDWKGREGKVPVF